MGLKIAAWILVLFVCFQLSYSTSKSDFERIGKTYGAMNIEDLLKSYKDEIARLSKKNSDAGFGLECPCWIAECMSSQEQLLSLFYRAAETPTMTLKEYKKNLNEILMDKCMDCLHRAWEKKEPKECMQDYHTLVMIQTNTGPKIEAAKKQSDGGKTEVSEGNASESEDQNGVKFVNGEIDFSSTTMEDFIKMYEAIVFTLKKEETEDAKIYKECPCYSPECVPTHEEILSLLKRSDTDPNMSKEQYSEELAAYANEKCIKCLLDRINSKEDCLKSYDTTVHLMAMMFRKLQEA